MNKETYNFPDDFGTPENTNFTQPAEIVYSDYELCWNPMNKNTKLLKEFTAYCKAHPKERFWQALRNWAKAEAICIARGWGKVVEDGVDSIEYVDTFYWEKKTDL
jgi:tripartite-type tricarboxylate transporter receptor subunit TctC